MTDTTARLSPLDDLHEAAGAVFTEFAGWRMPLRFGSELAEHTAVRTAAGLFDLSHMAEILVVGPGAAEALDHALASRLSALGEGRAKYTLLLAEDGGILDDLIVYRTGSDRFLVVANASNREVVASELEARASGFDAQVFDETDDIALIALQGPLSTEVLDNLEVELAADYRGLGRYRSVAGRWNDHELLVARTGYTGEDGFEFYLSPEGARALWTAIADTGAGSGLLRAGLAARDSLRLEAGMPLYGNELSRAVRPAQAGLGGVVAFDGKGDFVGRSALEQQDAPGRVLVGLRAEGKRAPRSGYPVLRDGSSDAPVGEVTSGALSPTLGYPIAMAYVDADAATPDSALVVDVRGTPLPVTVVKLPFYRKA